MGGYIAHPNAWRASDRSLETLLGAVPRTEALANDDLVEIRGKEHRLVRTIQEVCPMTFEGFLLLRLAWPRRR
jgi:hypothetical protein